MYQMNWKLYMPNVMDVILAMILPASPWASRQYVASIYVGNLNIWLFWCQTISPGSHVRGNPDAMRHIRVLKVKLK